MTDRRSLSRRKLLWAAATVGAAASAGSGATAMMTDDESTRLDFAAGILEVDTSWKNAGGTGGGSSITLSEPEGQETLEITVSGNPSYVWFRTRCKQCTEDEKKLNVRFGLETEDGDVEWLDEFESFRSLRSARELLGEGYRLGKFAPDDTRDLVVEWETGTLIDDLEITLDFGLYATQRRHVMNAESVGPAKWDGECDTDCEPTAQGGSKSISWVAFCSPDNISPDDITLDFSDDERTVEITDLSSDIEVGTVLLKYSLNLDVSHVGTREIVAGRTFTAGEASETYLQETGNGGGNDDKEKSGGGYFPDTETERTQPRSNGDPCPGSNWIKYETDDDRWYTSGGED